MQKSKIETLIQKYLSNRLNEQEFEELKQWLEEDASHKETFVKLLSLRHVNNQLALLRRFDKEGSWEALQKRCKQKRTLRRHVAMYASAAAVAALMGIASFLYFNNHSTSQRPVASNETAQADISTISNTPKATLVLANQPEIELSQHHQEINDMHISNGQIVFPQEDGQTNKPVALNDHLLQNQIKVPKGSEYSIVLSDGTKVKLNADSHLDFPVQFGEVREVKLEGEAFFEVTHDERRPFIVKANHHAIHVLGTTFNVTAYPDEGTSVTLVSGKVKVVSPSGEYYLSDEEQYVSSSAQVNKVDAGFYTSWTTGSMEFDAMPFPMLVNKLSRCYNVEFKIASKELETMKFTGVIFRNKPLDFTLDIIHRVSDVQFERKGRVILIKKQ